MFDGDGDDNNDNGGAYGELLIMCDNDGSDGSFIQSCC